MKKKLFKTITGIMLAIITFSTFTETTNAVASSIKLGGAESIPGYVAGTYFTTKTTKSGKLLYCLNIHKATAKNTTATLVKERDAGLAYIVKNGYPNKSFTGNKKKDYYITQTAVWWYLDDTAGGTNLTKSFKTTGSDKYNLRPYIKKLVNGAKKAKKEGYAKTSINTTISNKQMSLSKDKKYYVSEAITVTSSNLDTYTVAIKNAPSGTQIIDTNGNVQKKFKAGKKFKIRVLASKISKSTNIKVSVSGTGSVEKVYEYAPSDSSMQHVITSYLTTEKKTVSDTLTVNVNYEQPSQITILKVDKANDKALAGAKMVLKNSSGTIIDSWTSTSSGHVVKELANGTYTVQETEAPENYKLNTTPVQFTITDSTKVQTVKFYNETEDKVVNIIKLDKSTEQPVAGAKLVLKDASGNEITNWISTTQGHIIKNLPNGTYTVEEMEAPSGYKLSEEKVEFTVSDANKDVSVKFYNEAKDRIVSITKIDASTNLPLAGAEIVVRDSEENEIARFTSTEEAYVITNIANGTYTVEEESAPEGYMRSEEIVTFTIDDENLSQQITIKNYKEVIVPDTSSNSSIILTIIGLSIIGLGIGFVRKNEQKSK